MSPFNARSVDSLNTSFFGFSLGQSVAGRGKFLENEPSAPVIFSGDLAVPFGCLDNLKGTFHYEPKRLLTRAKYPPTGLLALAVKRLKAPQRLAAGPSVIHNRELAPVFPSG
jgi:hypothetical protein